MYIKLLIAFIVFTVLISCSGTISQESSIPQYSEVPVVDTLDQIATDISGSDSLQTAAQDTVPDLNLNQRVAEAETLCSQNRFLEADSILRYILSQVDSLNEAETDNFQSDSLVESILQIYTLMMPPEFLPDDIALIQFNRQMQASLDSLIYSSADSAIISKLVNRKDISYDVPMVWNEKVIKALSYYIRSKPQTISRWLERAAYYLPVMKKMFVDSGLPQDLAYLPLIESGFNTQAYSRAKAAGIWQFIQSTGKLYGLRHSYWFDERRDPLKSTESAIKYLKKLYGDFGNWHLALAAYNCGEGGVGRAINRSGTTDYWQLPLPRETKNYVPSYLAALTIAKNPDIFNITTDSAQIFDFDTVHLSECIDMRDIADSLKINFEELKKNNPHITHWCTPPDVSDVCLYLPKGTNEAFYSFVNSIPDDKKVRWYVYKIRRGDYVPTIAKRFKVSADAIREINRLNKKSKIIAGKNLFIPIPAKSDVTQYTEITSGSSSPASGTKRSAVPKNGGKIQYKVKTGETISEIALMFDVSEGELEDWNNVSHSRIRAGQVLNIYSNGSEHKKQKNETQQAGTYKVVDGDTPYSVSRKFDITLDELVALNNLDKNNPVIKIDQMLSVKQQTVQPAKRESVSSSNMIKYEIVQGDNLYKIAQNFSISLEELMNANDFNDNTLLHAGQIIRVPSNGTSRVRKSQEISANVVIYKVKQGDNLWNIAANFGTTVQSLYKLNDLNKDSVIMPGDTLKVLKSREL
jgi:membrane-bound lytic murein transglycosylase D